MKIVILYSGGLDSMILYRWTRINYPAAEIMCLYYDYGNPVCLAEIKSLPPTAVVKKIEWFNNSTQNLRSKDEDAHKGNIYIPGRNLVFATLAACQELPDYIFMGGLSEEAHERATDKNVVFIDKFNDVMQYVLSPFKHIELRFPFVENNMTKGDIIKWALKNGVTVDDIISTYSCYAGTENETPCGICHACIKNFSYFYWLGLPFKSIWHPFTDSDAGIIHLTNSVDEIYRRNFDMILINDICYEGLLQYLIDTVNKTDIDTQNLRNRIEKIIAIKHANRI